MNRYSKFLIIALALTAFLVGYLAVKGDIGPGSKSKTGTILDKFGDEQPTMSNEQLTEEPVPFALADRKIISPATSPDKKSVLYYEKNTGKMFEFNLADKTEKVISDKILPNFMFSIWSPAGKDTVSSYYSQTDPNFKHYGLDNGKTTELDNNIQSVAFSPDGNLIAYYYFNKTADPTPTPLDEPDPSQGLPDLQTGKIMVAQPDGQYQKKILDTRIEDIKISWPSNEYMVLKTPASGIYLLTQDGKLNKFLEPLSLFEDKWSQSGKKMLFSALTGNMSEPSLSVKDVDTREERPLNIEGSASKCAWSIDDVNIFCALSKSPSADEIYLINTSDGSRKLIAEPGVLIKELLLSSAEDYLLFISASDDKLYAVKLAD